LPLVLKVFTIDNFVSSFQHFKVTELTHHFLRFTKPKISYEFKKITGLGTKKYTATNL